MNSKKTLALLLVVLALVVLYQKKIIVMPWDVDPSEIQQVNRQSIYATRNTAPEVKIPEILNSAKPEEFPEHGTVKIFTDQECVAPFVLTTPEDFNYYYIKLKPSNQTEETLTIYMSGNSTFETTAPLGKYDLMYSCGNIWYGEKDLFGINTQCYIVDEQAEFYKNEDGIIGFTIKFRVIDGNTHSDPISKSKFNN